MVIAAPASIRKTAYPNAASDATRHINGADVRKAANLFKVLSHPDRLRLACRIGEDRQTTQKQLIDEFGWSQPTTARHLAALRDAGLVAAERSGGEVLLRPGDEIGLQLMSAVCDWLHAPAPESGADRPLTVPPPFSPAAVGLSEGDSP
jgi:ArsR family transcriptional regulator